MSDFLLGALVSNALWMFVLGTVTYLRNRK